MLVELYTVCDIMGPTDPETNQSKIIKKNILVKREFDNSKTKCEQHINRKGQVSKSYTNVYEDGEFFKVKGSYEYIKDKLKDLQPIKVKGYLGHAKSNIKN